MDKFKVVANLVADAERHGENMSEDRLRAIEYYQGEMKDTPADAGTSQMTTRDVRANVKKVLPSLMRTLLGNDEVGEFQPVEERDMEACEQATDYINQVVFPEVDGRKIIESALHDALLLRNGIIKWWYEEKQCVEISKHSGLSEDALGVLAGGDDVEVVEQNERLEQIETPGGVMSVPVYDIKIRRTYVDRAPRAASVPRENFLIHSNATDMDDSPIVGEKTTISRSDLVKMGYSRKQVDDLPIGDKDDTEQDARRDAVEEGHDVARASQMIDFYDIYVRVDVDGDGIAELRHMLFAGGLTEKHLLEDDECDEVQYCDISIMSQPHQWEGISLADDLTDIQRAKTSILRDTINNIKWQNNMQPVVDPTKVSNMDAVMNPQFGLPIFLKAGGKISDAIGVQTVPFVADASFGMLNYFDEEAQERTGVSDASAGLAPDALQNMTAKASAMIEQAGIGQTELMVATAAQGVGKFLSGLLRLVIRHQDQPRMVRLRNKWVEVDPRHWNAGMDCKVNTGLGAGTRERDMAMMQVVLGLQEKLLNAFGPANNPYVTPENLHSSITKLAESAGLRTPSLYFTEPDPEQIKAKIAAEANKPDPEQAKLEAQMQLEQAKMQGNQAKEQAQMEADLTVKQAEIAARTQAQAEKLQSDAAIQERQLQWEAEKFQAEMALRREEMAQKRLDDMQRAQAAGFAKTIGQSHAV